MSEPAIFIASFADQCIREKVMMEKPKPFMGGGQISYEHDLKEYNDHVSSRRTFPYPVKEDQDGKELVEGVDFKFKMVDRRENSNDVPEWQTIAIEQDKPEKPEMIEFSIAREAVQTEIKTNKEYEKYCKQLEDLWRDIDLICDYADYGKVDKYNMIEKRITEFNKTIKP